jgi:hypothetical protein
MYTYIQRQNRAKKNYLTKLKFKSMNLLVLFYGDNNFYEK